MNQNNGYLTFLKLLEDIKRLEEVNTELALAVTLAEKNQTNSQQINQSIAFMENIERRLPGIYNSSSVSKDKK